MTIDRIAEPESRRQDAEIEQALSRRFIQLAPSFSRPRATSFVMRVGFGSLDLITHVQDGKVRAVRRAADLPPLQSFDFSIRATGEAWRRFWQRIPPPGSHDLFALARNGEMTIEGNLKPMMVNLQFVKDLLAIGRESQP